MAIKFYIDEQTIELKTEKDIASDTIDFVELSFSFDNTWEGYSKTVQFTQRTNTYSVPLGVKGSICYLPNEITDGLCSISIFGIKGGRKRATTVPCQVRIKRSGFMEETLYPESVTPTIVEQLTEKVDKNAEDIKEITQDIDKNAEDIKEITQDIEKNKEDIEALKTNTGNKFKGGFEGGRDYMIFALNKNTPLNVTHSNKITFNIADYDFINEDNLITVNAENITLHLQLYSALKIFSSDVFAVFAANPRIAIVNPRLEDGVYTADIALYMDQALTSSTTYDIITAELYWV